jgi:hypothetical protein
MSVPSQENCFNPPLSDTFTHGRNKDIKIPFIWRADSPMEEMSKRHGIVAALAICSGIYIFPAS